MSDFGLKTVEAHDYHRNGVGGNGFHVAIFKASDGVRYLAIRTKDTDGVNCFVLDLDKAHAGNIEFGSNSWRGDNFACEAADLIRETPEVLKHDLDHVWVPKPKRVRK